MKTLQDTLGIILIIFFFSSCTISEKRFESKYWKEVYKDSSSLEFFNAIEEFDKYLLDNHFIEKSDKNSYKKLMYAAIKDEVILKIDSNFYKKVDGYSISRPSNFGFGISSIYCAYNEWTEKPDTNNLTYKYSQILKKIHKSGDIGNIILNEQLFDVLEESDFGKPIFKAPIITIIYAILDYNYSSYHYLKPENELYFVENDTLIDFEKSELRFLDSLCKTIVPENRTIYSFLALGIDNVSDSVDYALTVKRTNYIKTYLINEKGLHPKQIKTANLHKSKLDNYNKIFEKRKVQLLYSERYIRK